jgi:hypothetical protein
MLFEFNKTWYNLFVLLTVWISYGVFGYEFCAITLLALILLSLKSEK